MSQYTNKKEEKEKEDPVRELEKIDSKYAGMDYVDAPSSLGLEKKEHKDMSDDELLEYAKNKLGINTDSEKTAISNKYDTKIAGLSAKNEEIIETGKQNAQKIHKAYDAAATNISDDALKRGLARSSIVISKIAGVESERAKELANELDNVNSKLGALENEISALSLEKEEALDAFDIAYASNIEKEIESKRTELEKQKQEVLEFNNKVDELEAEYKLSLDAKKQEKKESNMQMKDKYGYTPDEVKAADEKYEYIMNYLSKLSREEALDLLLTNDDLQDLLGERFMDVYAYTRKRES